MRLVQDVNLTLEKYVSMSLWANSKVSEFYARLHI